MPFIFNPLTGEFNISGGGGGATFPTSSVANSLVVFGDTTGKSFVDAQTAKTARIPIGDTADGSGVMGLQWYGTGTAGAIPATPTGMKLLYQNTNLYEEHLLDGKQIMVLSATVNGDQTTTDVAIQAQALRPDNVTATLGTTTRPWFINYSKKLSVPSSIGRAIVIGNSNDASVTGIGMDAAGFGREVYFQVDAGSAYLDYFNVRCASPYTTTTISAPDEATANSTAALTFVIKAPNKTAGTGNGGNTVMGVGTSAGGEPGHFYIPSVAGAPSTTPVAITGQIAMQFDSTNNKLYAYLNGAWKAVTLT